MEFSLEILFEDIKNVFDSGIERECYSYLYNFLKDKKIDKHLKCFAKFYSEYYIDNDYNFSAFISELIDFCVEDGKINCGGEWIEFTNFNEKLSEIFYLNDMNFFQEFKDDCLQYNYINQ